jgi:hypothetical protein
MNGVNLSSISAGAMTAAVSIGSSLQAIGAGATAAAQTALPAALPAMGGGSVQALGSGVVAATSQAATAAAAIPQALPGSVHAGAATTAQLARDLAVVEKPTRAMAAAMPKAGVLVRTAGFLSRALPIVTIGAGALAGARIVEDHGAAALITHKQGRGAVLSTLGGALLLVPTPATQLAAAGVLAAVAVNQFGGMDRLDSIDLAAARGRLPWQR